MLGAPAEALEDRLPLHLRHPVAVVPDLFWRMEPGVELGYDEADFQKAFDFYGKFDVDQGIKDVQSAITHVRGMEGVKGKVGAVGYCLGGLLAWQ